jgi:glycosyltransferase involved in cell wall biosynthesis
VVAPSTTTDRQSITVVIPTKNSAALIGDCLESVKWADEIIVVDMHSTDATQDICSRYSHVRVIECDGYIFGNMNVGFDNAASEWTMRMDSDERVTAELAAQIKAVLRSPPPEVNGFYFRQRLIVLNHVLRHGRGLNSRREMMFKTGHVRYKVQSEHESLPTDETWRDLDGYYVHINYESVSQYLAKTDYYTTRDVARMDFLSAPRLRDGIIAPLRAFYLYYLRRRGFRDGWPGLLDAGMMAMYQFVQWAKLQERHASMTKSGA